MKALVLAGGRGTRLDDIFASKSKCMVEVNGRPALEYSLDSVADTDIEEIIIVVGYRAEEIINHYGTEFNGKRLAYAIQWEQKGLVHAIDSAREALGGDDFMLLLGDEILANPRHRIMLDEFSRGDVFGLCGVLPVEDKDYIRRTYAILQDESRRIYRLVEKPRTALNNIMGTGNCVFSNRILDYIEITPIHHERREKELPDLIQCAVDDGQCVKAFHIATHYANINTEHDIELAAKLIQLSQC